MSEGRWYTSDEWERLNGRCRERAEIKARVDRMSPAEYLAYLAEERAAEERRKAEARAARERHEQHERLCAAAAAADATPRGSHGVHSRPMVSVKIGTAEVLVHPLRAGQTTIDAYLPDVNSHRALLNCGRSAFRFGGAMVLSVECRYTSHSDPMPRVRIHLDAGILPPALW